MAHKIGIYYDQKGLRNIMKGPEIANLEQQIMMQKLDRVRAEFLHKFGFSGGFEIKKVDTNSRRSRTTFRIIASDARTAAALKKESGWLAKFI